MLATLQSSPCPEDCCRLTHFTLIVRRLTISMAGLVACELIAG